MSLVTCSHGYLQMTCPTCAGGRRPAVQPAPAQGSTVTIPGAGMLAGFGVPPSGHSDEKGTIDLNEVLAEASARAAQTARREEH